MQFSGERAPGSLSPFHFPSLVFVIVQVFGGRRGGWRRWGEADLEEHEYLQGKGCSDLITKGAMKHNWGLEFQEREEKPNDYLRSVMVTNQSRKPAKLPVVGLYILLFLTGSKALNASALSPPVFQGCVCVCVLRVGVWRLVVSASEQPRGPLKGFWPWVSSREWLMWALPHLSYPICSGPMPASHFSGMIFHCRRQLANEFLNSKPFNK